MRAPTGIRPIEPTITGTATTHLAEERAGDRITFADTQIQPRAVITSPEWSGSETGGRRDSPFTVNVDRKKPWHTLTGRMQFFVDHDWMHELGEALPNYRPPLDYRRHFGEQGVAPWFRGLFAFSPAVSAIDNAPIIYQVHASAAWLIWAVWPFSRLVHAWSAPLWYLWRPYVVYRSRRALRPAEPGTSGRRWRRIGVPY